MEVLNIIVHEVSKDAADAESKVLPRVEENPVDELTLELHNSLGTLFNKTGLMNGGFEEVEEGAPQTRFVEALEDHYKDGGFRSFVKFTRSSAYYLSDELDRAGGSKGGYLLFYHYVDDGVAYLCVALLRKTAGITLDEALSLSEVERLDLDKLHMAAKINLTDWVDGESEKYICFKKSGRARGLSDYFTKFIGCSAYTHARLDTRALISAVTDYCQNVGMSSAEIEATKQRALGYCNDCLEAGEPLWLDKFSAFLDGERPTDFLRLAQGAGFELSNEINLDPGTLSRFTRISIVGYGLRLNFDSELLHKEQILFDEDEESLLITKLPEAAVALIRKNL